MMIGLLCDDELYLVEKTPELIELIKQHYKEVGTKGSGKIPETHTPEWKEYSYRNWPATTELDDLLETLEPTPMPYSGALDMIARLSLEW